MGYRPRAQADRRLMRTAGVVKAGLLGRRVDLTDGRSQQPRRVTLRWHYSSMATVKVTLSLPPETVELLSDAATRLARPKSMIVREAIQEFHAGIDRLSSAERVRMLAVLDEFAATPRTRSDDDVERELEEVREARRSDIC